MSDKQSPTNSSKIDYDKMASSLTTLYEVQFTDSSEIYNKESELIAKESKCAALKLSNLISRINIQSEECINTAIELKRLSSEFMMIANKKKLLSNKLSLTLDSLEPTETKISEDLCLSELSDVSNDEKT